MRDKHEKCLILDNTMFISNRMNLDPFGVYNDETIWKALKLSKTENIVTELDGGN